MYPKSFSARENVNLSRVAYDSDFDAEHQVISIKNNASNIYRSHILEIPF